MSRARNERGFALAEVVVAMTLFLLIAIGLEATLAGGVAGQRVARERTVAEQVVTDQIETIRNLDYDDIGTVGGNPPGTVAATQNLAVAGFGLTVRTRIRYVDDPLPGGYITRANYKRVFLTVTETSTSRVLARHETYVAPPTQPLRNRAIVRAQIVDFALSTPVEGVITNLETGPSAPISDTSEPDGMVTFVQLVPNPLTGPQAYYDLRVVAPGYETLNEDEPPSASAHTQLAASEVFTTSIRIYRPATMNIRIEDPSGALYTLPSWVTIASSRGTAEFSVTGGLLTVTNFLGEPVVSGLQYSVAARSFAVGQWSPSVTQTVPSGYPTNLTSSFTTRLAPFSHAPLQVFVRRTNGTPVSGARVDVTGGPGATLVTGLTNPAGIVLLNVPRGNGYTIAAKGPAGEQGQTTANVPGPGQTNATVTVS